MPYLAIHKLKFGMPDIVKLSSYSTKLNADAVEWCPIEGYQNILICATYELIENEDDSENGSSEQYRQGLLYVYELQSDLTLKEVSTLKTHGILDCKWSRHLIAGRMCLAAVDAVGHLNLYDLDGETKALTKLHSVDLSNGSHTLMLSLDWSNVLNSSDSCSIAVSDSAGFVHVVSLAGTDLTITSSRKAHDFEAWITSFDYFNTSIFYSGGDDSKLKVHDSRVSQDAAVHTNREHTAGVTSIQSNWKKEYSLVTGSYDERILFWDSRSMSRPSADISAPGGVWRIKHDPFNCYLIASPCMYGGSVVIDTEISPQTVACYNFHSDINYGIDWCWKTVEVDDTKELPLLAVCSFYDKLLSIATYTSKTLSMR